VFPLVATCLHISKDNKIIVAIREKESVDPERERRKVVVLCTSGKQEMVYDLDLCVRISLIVRCTRYNII
jgi:hypothetical protein